MFSFSVDIVQQSYLTADLLLESLWNDELYNYAKYLQSQYTGTSLLKT